MTPGTLWTTLVHSEFAACFVHFREKPKAGYLLILILNRDQGPWAPSEHLLKDPLHRGKNASPVVLVALQAGVREPRAYLISA